MIKFGIVGTGWMAAKHAEGTALEGVELTACCDVDAERSAAFAATHGFKRSVTSYEDLLGLCDAVAVVTPDRFHAALSLQALAAGKHLMCEKPLTTTFEDAVEVAAAARAAHAAGQVSFINFTYRNSAAWQEARRLIADGALGEVRHASGRYLQSWLASSSWGPWTSETLLWRCEAPTGPGGELLGPASGGVLGDVGCHLLDFLTGLTGEPAAVRCTARTFPLIDPDSGEPVTEHVGRPLDANSFVSIELDLAGGGLARAEASRWASGHPNQVVLGIHGTEGSIEIDLEDSWTRIRHCLGQARHRDAWTSVDLPESPTNHARFVASIRGGEPDQPDVLRGAEVQAMLEACDRSAGAGHATVPIPTV